MSAALNAAAEPQDGNFASQLRAQGESIRIGGGAGHDTLSIRVQMPEIWDVVRMEAAPDTPVSVVKEAALKAMYPDYSSPDRFMMKINGFEVLDEAVGAAAAGAADGSTFLLTFRRRRPVR